MDRRDGNFSQSFTNETGAVYRNINESYINGSSKVSDASIEASPTLAALRSPSLKPEMDQLSFSMNDFPALAPNGDLIGSKSSSNGLYNTSDPHSRTQSPLTGIGGLNMMSANSNYSQLAKQRSSNFRMEKEDFPSLKESSGNVHDGFRTSSVVPSGKTVSRNEGEDGFKLEGFLKLLERESSGNSRSGGFLTFGTDSSTLKVDVASDSPICDDFGSICFSHSPRVKIRKEDPPFAVPKSYFSLPRLKSFKKKKLDSASYSTLFYLFYSCPGDELQVLAAQELYKRRWMFHFASKIWFISGSQQSNNDFQVAPNQLVYFDRQTWKKKLFVGRMQGPPEKQFMSLEQVNSILKSKNVS